MVISHRLAAAGVAALALLAPSGGAWADYGSEEADGWTTEWSNGFKVEDGDDFKLKFGGQIQADYSFADPDPASAWVS